MFKVLLQAGHKNIKSNCVAALRSSTGAGGEVEVNIAVVNTTAELLRARGVEVKVVDANFNCDPTSLDTDWDLFLSCHCDMDYANDSGSGFCDFPEPSTDGATLESQRMAKVIQDTFFPAVGINVRSRSNAKTRYYYMWASISAKTPCVLIEMGQIKDLHDAPILRDTIKVSQALSGAILTSLGVPINNCEKELDEMRQSRNKWRTKYEEADRTHTEDLKARIEHIEGLQATVAELNNQLALNSGFFDSYAKDIEMLQGTVSDRDDEITVLRGALDEVTKENKRLAGKLLQTELGWFARLLKFLKGSD